MGERGSMQTTADFNQLDVEIEQRPLASWAVVAHLSIFVVTPLSMLVGAWFLGLPWFLGAAAFFAYGLVKKRPVTLVVTRTDVRVDAWSGWPGRHTVRTLPLVGLEVDHDGGASINKRRTYRLTLTPAVGAPMVLRSLACTGAELERLDRLLGEASEDAAALMGDGAAEVPDDLRRIVGQALSEGPTGR